jgi:NAD(P)-dependent dehydrogenase (short-subunit alcohol dehydrogenase family)
MTPNFALAGKVIAVTGGASGIGLATAQLLIAQGAHVSVADVSANALKDAEQEFAKAGNGKFFTQVVDVRKSDQVQSWIANTVDKFGKLDGGVNLAGVIPRNINIERVEECNEDDWVNTIDINLTGGKPSLTTSMMACWYQANHLDFLRCSNALHAQPDSEHEPPREHRQCFEYRRDSRVC